LALVASAGIASAATSLTASSAATDAVAGEMTFTVDGGTATVAPVLGDTITVDPGTLTTLLGGLSGVTSVDPFDIVLTGGSDNDGTVIEFGDFTFTITDTTVSFIGGPVFLVGGLGELNGPGFSSTEGSFSVSSSDAFSNTGAGTFSIVSPPDPAFVPPVPLPAGLPLLVAGLGALALLRRSRKTA
jgi:hypothetical protein